MLCLPAYINAFFSLASPPTGPTAITECGGRVTTPCIAKSSAQRRRERRKTLRDARHLEGIADTATGTGARLERASIKLQRRAIRDFRDAIQDARLATRLEQEEEDFKEVPKRLRETVYSRIESRHLIDRAKDRIQAAIEINESAHLAAKGRFPENRPCVKELENQILVRNRLLLVNPLKKMKK